MTAVPPSAPDASASLQSLLRSFTGFDWLITALALWSVGRGLVRGLIRELFAFAGLVAGILVAAWYYAPCAGWLSRWVSQPHYAAVAAFLLLAVLTIAGVSLLGRLVRSAAHLVGLGLPDRLAGALFGLLRASLVGAAILMACTAFLPPLPAVRQSRLAPALLAVTRGLSFLSPGDLQVRIAQGIEHLHHGNPPIP